MDLIAQLIQNKKNAKDVLTTLKTIIEEIIKYEKLARSPKFKSIAESPVLQKQLPEIWNAFNRDTQSMYTLETAMSIIAPLMTEPLHIFEEYKEFYKPREKKQLTIVGNTNAYRFVFEDTRTLAYDDISDLTENHQLLCITETIGNIYHVVMVLFTGEGGKIYHYETQEADVAEALEEEPTKKQYVPQSYKVKIDDIEVEIKNYSYQGNNEHYFANLVPNEHTFIDVSIIDNTIHYRISRSNVPIEHMSIEMKGDEVNQLTMATSLRPIAELLVEKYKELSKG